MEDKQKKGFDFSSFDLILYIKERFWPLFIITVVAAVVAVVVSFMLEEKFRATMTVFPAPNTSVSKELFTDRVTDKNISQFGEEEEIEKLLQVLRSDAVKSKIIQKYDLMGHYDIEKDSKYPMTQLYREYDNNISASETEFMSIRIDVLDKDPEMAAAIANDLGHLLDSSMNAIALERARKGLQIAEKEYNTRRREIHQWQDSLRVIRQKGVIDYESQAEVYNQAYAEAIKEGKMRQADIIKQKLDTIAQYGGAYVFIRDFVENETEQLSDLKSRLEEARVNATQTMPKILIVNKAMVPEKKAYPVRSLIVVITTLSTALLALIVALAIDYFKNYYLDYFKKTTE